MSGEPPAGNSLNFPPGGSMCLVATNSAKTINLPAPDTGRVVHIVDSTGGANQFPITILPTGADVTIRNGYNTIVQPFGTLSFLANNNNWYAIVNESGIDNLRTINASNISVDFISTNYGFFSTISTGSVFGKHIGDGSLLTNLTVVGLTTISNLLNSVSTNVTNVSTNLNTLSNNVTTVSNTAGTNATNITTISNRINYLLTVSSYSAITMSTSFGFFSTISTGSIYGRHIGDGSLLTGLPAGGLTALPPIMSTTVMSSGIITGNSISTLNISSALGYISSLTVDSLSFGIANGFINMGDLITTSMSSIQIFTSSLLTTNLQVGIVSSLSYIAFPGLQLGYNQSVVAEQAIGTGLQELLVFKGSSASDRIRMQTTGSIIFEPGVSARLFPTAGSNVTPAMIINTSSNVGIGIAVPTTTLDVAGTGRFQMLSTQQLFVSTISTGTVYGRHIGDGSLLTGLPAGGLTIIPPFLSTTTLSTNLLTASNISTNAISTNNLTVSNLYGNGITVLTGLSVNTISTNQVNSASISNSGVISTLGLNVGSLSSINISTVNLAAGFISSIVLGSQTAYITNLYVGTEDFGSALTASSNITQTGGTTTLAGLSVNTISTNQMNSSNICNAGWLSNGGVLSNTTAAAFFQATSNTTTLGVAQTATFASNITQTAGTTTLAGLSVNTLSTNQINSSNICNAGWLSNGGILSNTIAAAFFQATSNTTTLGVAQTATFASNITQTGGTTTLAGLSVNTLSTNQINSSNISTAGINVGSLSSINISTLNLAAGFISTLTLGARTAYITNLFVGTEDFGNALTSSSNITQTGGTTTLTGLSVNTISTNFVVANNISVASLSTIYGFFSTISSGSFYGQHIGDGSLLTNIPNNGAVLAVSNSLVTTSTNLNTLSNSGRFPAISTNTISTSLIIAGYMSSPQAYISSLIVDSLAFGLSNSYISMGDIITTSISTTQVFTSSLLTTNLQVGTVSSLSYIAFPGLQLGYNQTVIAEQAIGTGLQELLVFRGSSASDRIRMQTTGSILFEPGVGARVFPATGSNVTPAMIINTSSNVGIGIAVPTTTLDVAGTGRFQILSTQQIFVSSISSGSVYGRFVGDGSLLTGLPAGGLTIIPPFLSTTTLSTNLLTASNISTNSISTNNLTVSNLYGTGITVLLGLSANTISTNQVNSASISNSGVISTLGLNVGSLSSINISTVNLAAGFISSIVLGAQTAYITNLFVGTEDFGSALTASSNITQTGGTTTLAGLSVNTISTNQINSSNICNAGWLSNGGILSNTTAAAFFQATSNTTTLGVAQTATFASNITQTGGTTTLAGLSVNTISTNQINSSNICNAGWLSNNGIFSNITAAAFFQATSNTTTLGVAGILTAASNITQTAGTTTLAGLSVNTLSTNQINSSNICNAGWLSNNGIFSNITAAAFFQATSNTTTLGVAQTATFASNITQTGGTTTLAGLSVNTISTNFIVTDNISVNRLSTIYGFFSTISTGSIYGKYIGDGSLLTGLPVTMPTVFSTLAFYASSISTTTIQTSNILIGTVSSQSYLAFPGLQQQYSQTVLAEVSTGTGLQEMLLFRGSTATDRIRMQTTGSIVFETGVGARVFPAAPSNATPAMIINTSSNVGIGIAVPTVTLDVAGAGRFQTLSTQQIYASSFVGGVVSSATVYASVISSVAGFFSSVNNYQVGGALYLPTQLFTF